MYLLFWILFFVVSLLLIFFILLQPGKGFNNSTYLSSQASLNLFRSISRNGFMTNLISLLAGCFLVISIILCNVDNQSTKKDFFWKDDKNMIIQKNTLDVQKKKL